MHTTRQKDEASRISKFQSGGRYVLVRRTAPKRQGYELGHLSRVKNTQEENVPDCEF